MALFRNDHFTLDAYSPQAKDVLFSQTMQFAPIPQLRNHSLPQKALRCMR